MKTSSRPPMGGHPALPYLVGAVAAPVVAAAVAGAAAAGVYALDRASRFLSSRAPRHASGTAGTIRLAARLATAPGASVRRRVLRSGSLIVAEGPFNPPLARHLEGVMARAVREYRAGLAVQDAGTSPVVELRPHTKDEGLGA